MLACRVLRRSYFLSTANHSFVTRSNVAWNPTAAFFSSSFWVSPQRNAPLSPNILLQSVQCHSLHHISTPFLLCNKHFSKSYSRPPSKTPNEDSAKQPEQKHVDGNMPNEELTLSQRIKRTYKEHMKIFAFFHFLQWGGAIFTFYNLISSGYDLSYFLNKAHISQMVIDASQTVYGKLAMAVALTKLTFPIRWLNSYVLTMLCMRLARSFNKLPPASKEDSVGNLRREAQHQAKVRFKAAMKKKPPR